MKPSKFKSETTKSSFKENIEQYLDNSSLHGLRYIGNTMLSAVERVFFGLSFLMVLLLAVFFISNIYHKWKNNPVLIGLDPVATDIKGKCSFLYWLDL